MDILFAQLPLNVYAVETVDHEAVIINVRQSDADIKELVELYQERKDDLAC